MDINVYSFLFILHKELLKIENISDLVFIKCLFFISLCNKLEYENLEM